MIEVDLPVIQDVDWVLCSETSLIAGFSQTNNDSNPFAMNYNITTSQNIPQSSSVLLKFCAFGLPNTLYYSH